MAQGLSSNASDTCRAAGATHQLQAWRLTAAEFVQHVGGNPGQARRLYASCVRAALRQNLPDIEQEYAAGELIKFTTRLADGARVESVIIPMDSYRGARWRTLCVSTQAGCRMGCVFCETGAMGLLRHLDAGEIVAQRLLARQILFRLYPPRNGPYRYDLDGIRNIVFMGMGEPLDNFPALARAIEILGDTAGLAFPLSHMTVSTVGVARGLEQLANWAREDVRRQKLRLAISLHAADDDLRSALVPANRALPLRQLKELLRAYPLPPRGLFLIQYVLLKGINDSEAHARQLAAWCQDLPCVVNLIPYNPQRAAAFQPPAEERVLAFLHTLRAHGVFAKRRVTQGREVFAACGQLAPNLHRAPQNLRGA
ncbi:MAG: dual-specificity RNA methyltransferase RlmN [Candidatus Binatia bacterium]|nr:MAG: dual-specificity RNA methyltransferase RlmN [Candidatus Binatia bacterium]